MFPVSLKHQQNKHMNELKEKNHHYGNQKTLWHKKQYMLCFFQKILIEFVLAMQHN